MQTSAYRTQRKPTRARHVSRRSNLPPPSRPVAAAPPKDDEERETLPDPWRPPVELGAKLPSACDEPLRREVTPVFELLRPAVVESSDASALDHPFFLARSARPSRRAQFAGPHDEADERDDAPNVLLPDQLARRSLFRRYVSAVVVVCAVFSVWALSGHREGPRASVSTSACAAG